MKKNTAVIILLAFMMLLCACEEESVTSSPTVSPTQTEQTYVPTPSGREFLYDSSGNVIQMRQKSDYSLMWWRDGFNKGGKQQINMQTGNYGVGINTSNGKITNLGALEGITEAEAAKADNQLIDGLDEITTSYFIFNDNQDMKYTGTVAIGGGNISSRILESGRYINRIDVMSLKFNGLKGAVGRVEIAAMPQYLALELGIFSPDEKREDIGAGIRFTVPEQYSAVYSSDRAVTLAKDNGEGFTVVVPEDADMELDGKQLTIKRKLKIKRSKTDGLSVVVIPSKSASGQDAVNYLAAEQLEANAVQILPKEGREQQTELDISKGYLSVDLKRMSSGRHYSSDEELNKIDSLKLSITNNSDADITIPVQLINESGDFPVEGMSCMLRDAETGEPTGNHVQVCRNWHSYTTDKNGNYAASNDPKRLWSGTWFHGYTLLDIPAGKTVTYEVDVIYAKWGGVLACSHSQLCLAGWGGNYQQWETSTLGGFSDSFCYDIEKAHGTGAAINDILPVLSYGTSGQKYRWSTGVSGSDFFALYDKNGKEIPLKQLTTRFIKQGPCITEVAYSGITKDESVKVDIKANMSRTNDAAKAIYTVRYEFLKDVEFSRIYFFSLGSDGYNTSFSKITIGNTDGGASFNLGGKSYADGTVDIDMTNISEGYLGSQMQQRIDIDGEGLFVLQRSSQMYQQEYGEPGARMINLISWNSVINGKSYNKPSVSIKIKKAHYGAYNIPCSIVELGAPVEAGSVIEKGSMVEGIVQFVPLPTHLGEGENGYYGTDEGMLAIEGEGDEFIKNLAMHFVLGDSTLTAQKGEILQRYPAVIKTENDEAEITLNGGTGHVALTFTGVTGSSGYVLERLEDGAWVKVDQSVYGNDYWQCFYDADSDTYEMTYNVPSYYQGEQRFRFRKG